MKPVLAWMKANLAVVILSALILLILPAAFVGTRFWNKRIQKSRETAANKAYGDLKALTISYALPPTTPTGTATTVSMDAPNSVATAFFQEHRTKLDSEISKVGDAAKEINQAGHKMLVDGLWVAPPAPPKGPADAEPPPPAPDAPKPPTIVDQFKALELAEMLVGTPSRPSVYEALLKGINAGGPADPVRVYEALSEEQGRFIDKVRAQNNREKLTNEEQAQLTKELIRLRVGQYQGHAAEISVYATRDCLAGIIPAAVPSEAPDATTCFQWQFDYWTVADLLRAVDAANTDSSGKRTTLDQSVVKRIERIELFGVMANEPSVTGRKSGGENKLYDVRDARLTLVVASAGLPALVNAISRTNFMTVIGLDFVEVDPWVDMEKGYYYGTDHVVRATVKVETIWLRSWTEAFMPEAYKESLAGTTPDAASSAPAPPRGRGAPAAPEDDSLRARPKGKSTSRPSGPPKRGGDGG